MGQAKVWWAVTVGLTLLAAGVIAGLASLGRSTSASSPDPLSPEPTPAPVKGVLTISAYGAPGATSDPASVDPAPIVHRTEIVRGPAYQGMEDNDIRGFLDGMVQWGWNQTTQVHVRVGRRSGRLRYGEPEIFRVLYRWDSLPLPALASVRSASLTLFVEDADDHPRRLVLYRVNKDWNPGTGGVAGDNISPPKPGEVWWNDARFDSVAWGLPGVGFVSDVDEGADTPLAPLAHALFQPGDTVIKLTSPELAAYATEQIRAGEAIRFLLKLADQDEDRTGSVMVIYSGNEGDSWNPARHPRLELEWEGDNRPRVSSTRVFLEYGRQQVLDQVPTPGAGFFDVSFSNDSAHTTPWIEVRGGSARDTSQWRSAQLPFRSDWDWIQVRLIAGARPVSLGEEFTAQLRDTWIRSRAPEEQIVPWIFISPSGGYDTLLAEYRGDNTWGVSYRPEEPGPWRYQWSQEFTDVPFQSAVGRFDVAVRDREAAWSALERLAQEIEDHGDLPMEDLRRRFLDRFHRLQRASLWWETPESFQELDRGPLLGLLSRIRTALAGAAIPDSIGLAPSPPAAWELEEGNG